MSLSLPSDVINKIQQDPVQRVLFVDFPDPDKNTTKHWTSWPRDIDATKDGTTNTYSSKDMRAPDIGRALNEELDDLRITMENVGGVLGGIITRNKGLYRNRVTVSSFEKSKTSDGEVITLDDWKIEQCQWDETEATVKIVPDLWIKNQKMTETAGRDRFPLADPEDTVNWKTQGRSSRTADSNK